MKRVSLCLILLLLPAVTSLRADEIASVQMNGGAVDLGQAAITLAFNWDITTGNIVGPTTVATFGLPPFTFLGVTLNQNVFDFSFQNALGDTWNMFTFPELALSGGVIQQVPYQFVAGEIGGIQDGLTCATPGDQCAIENLGGFYPLQGQITTLSVVNDPTPSPEPGPFVLLALGLCTIFFFFWRPLRTS